ncbi:Srd anti-sigma factor [Paramecium bursaria Chlorella virus NY2A]|uniref:Uncharacterized protein B805R n=2 Tax=Chlorovirus TaxID=181083 RepID=A7IXY0_PBCVN|nr:Srd anti-sigma factor [Paramecium bursaria Chlorella virus NY2A]YP_009665547.1 Srd anti-sigma factor [Paramecium bursaria Chlorella virus NYs1]ABT15204.1 hypothetical protein NY2A_B805R [Paramecium bursaria Chlorella virus NY2A]AGE55085.1 hypothetical protein PBCVMA1D_830R [Paramecium bursaria Chlorella virus MA1D]AGE58902.1 hypothetical protein PBCVNYs1_838R [Paramecium bursaria Chlorella virus NYs1]
MLCIRCNKPHNELTKTCRPCKDYQRQYREENKEHILEKARQYYEENKEEIQEKKRQYREENKEHILEKARQYYEENKEEIQEKNRQYYEDNKDKIRQYREDNKDKILEYKRQYYEDNREKIQQYRASVHGKFVQIQAGARQRGLLFDLVENDVGNITDDPCFYCGEETTLDTRNGLDRLDNDVGYTVGNVVSCCGTCNYMKRCLDPMTFVERCAQVAFHNGHEGRTTEYWDIIKGHMYDDYKSRMNKDFDLTKEQYYNFHDGDCVYCGRESANGHMNGIDRVNNDIGYTVDNCVSCCGDCNYAKGSSTVEDFIAKCVMIASRTHDIPENIPRQVKMILRR